MTAIGAVGIELWSMSSDLYFDNLIITDSLDIAKAWAADTFDLKLQKLGANDSGMISRIINYSNRNPWLYAVYVVVVGLPLVLIITFCCSGDSQKSNNADDSKSDEQASGGKNKLNHPKKTDEIQEDDREEEEEEEEEEIEEEQEEEEEQQVKQRKSTRSRRARVE